jgi:L-lactate dehydrogenase complex protein LldG
MSEPVFESLFESFRVRAEAVSASVQRFPGKLEALGFILETLAREEVSDAPDSHAVWAPCRFLYGLDGERIARVPGVRLEVTRALAATAKVGISQVDLAVADTGTLVVASAAVEQRLASTLPMAHIAIIASSQIVPDLPAVLARLPPGDHPYFTLITGPSRTADIERVLTIGVHGPERLYIVFVDDL